ncbi:MAG: transglutaminase family protein [Actinomycetota bacterium]
MAAKQDVAPRAQRLAALGAVAFLAVATALAFGRVFVGHAATWKLLAAAVLSVGLAALLERRSLLLATAVSAIALLVVIGVFVFPGTTWLGLPTRETLRATLDALGRVGHDARVQVAPSEPLRPLILAALTAVWTASFSAHALAIRAGSPLLSVLPPVALVGFADTVLEDGARPFYALLLLAAALLVVFMDGLRRIRQWGPVWSSPGRRRLSSVAGRGARRVGITAVIAALAFPGVLPGFRSDALIDFSSGSGQGVHLDPFISIRNNLTRTQPVPLYKITSTDQTGNAFPAYWRAYTLDLFNGEAWTTSDPSGERGTTIAPPIGLPQTVRAPDDATTIVTQKVELLQDQHDTALPLAYPAISVLGPMAEIRYNPQLGTVTVPGTLAADTSYTVTSDVVIPTPEQLDAVTMSSPDPRYVYLPKSMPPGIAEIAHRWTDNVSPATPYRKVLAIMDRLSETGGFVYDERVDPRDDANALVDFLTKTRRGFCQQFAAAMAVLVRELGYPARVAVGYRSGQAAGAKSYLVSTHDAHAWVEVYFPGYGWLPFEPTPKRPNPVGSIENSYLNPAPPAATGGDQQGTADGGKNGSQAPRGPGSCIVGGRRAPATSSLCSANRSIRPEGFAGAHGAGAATGGFTAPADGYGVPLRLVLLVLVLLGLVLLVLIPAVKWGARLRIAHRRAPPRETVLAAFRLFDGEAADLGLGRRPGETLLEYRRRLDERVRFSDGHLGRLTAAATRAAYADGEVQAAEARAALADAKVAIRDVRRDAGVTRRLLGVYRPGI